MDLSAAEKLGSLVERLRADGYEISFCSFKDNVLELLERSGVVEKIGRDHIFPTQVQAVSAIHGRAHRGSSEENCPLLPMLPRVAGLSLRPDGAYRDAKRHGLALCSRIVAIRFDGPLDRGSVEYFLEEVNRSVRRRPDAHHVMIAAHAISWIDREAVRKLAALVEDLRGRGYRVCFSGLTDEVVDVLQKGNAYRTIGVANMFATQVAAVGAIHAESHQGAQETRCPLREAVSRD
jgi:MFS superfamily sulfate permease-like transporter